MADIFRVLGIAQEMSESVRAWRVVRESGECAQKGGFLFAKNMEGRNKKRSKQKKQRSWGGNRGNPRHGRRKMMQK